MDDRKTVEAWAAELSTPDWLLAAARTMHRWPVGRELTRDEYTSALERAAHVQLR